MVIERVRQLRQLRDQLLQTGDLIVGKADVRRNDVLRPDIAKAWQRCVLSGVVPDSLTPQYVSEEYSESQLRRTAAPVIAKLTERLANTSTCIMLADRTGVILDYWTDDAKLGQMLERSHSARGFVMHETVVGNNGMGSVLEEFRPIWLSGAEHFADAWLNFTCAGAPIRHPITRKLDGVLNITCRAKDANHLMLPIALEAAQEIERRLYLGSSRNERFLLEKFLSVDRGNRPVIVLNDQMVISNPAAARVLDDLGQAFLWEYAASAIESEQQHAGDLSLRSGGSVKTRCEPVADGRSVIGALIEILPPSKCPSAGSASPNGRILVRGRTAGVAPRTGGVWRQLCEEARRLSDAGLPLFVVGEEGVGKLTLITEVFADAQDRERLNVIDCTRQPVEGIATWITTLEASLAEAGSVVVLRHLGALDLQVARAVCSVIDRHDGSGARLVTTANPSDLIDPAYRPLLDRLAVATVRIPALRERIQELPELLEILTRKHAIGLMSPRWLPDAIQALSRLDWPGNVRQLENVVRRVLASQSTKDIRAGGLPEEVRGKATRRRLSHLERVEVDAIIAALRRSNGNKSEAAEFLGISRATLYRKIRQFGIDLERSIF